jgi:hypothetical protein
MGIITNQFTTMPSIPYKLISALLTNDDLFNLIYYNTKDALSQPHLSMDEKLNTIWQGQSDMENYNIFMTNIDPNMQLDSKTLIKVYKYTTYPNNLIMATLCYRFDVLFGTKIPLVDYEGITCNRGDVIEYEILKTLNGKDVAGVGYLQYNHELSRSCSTLIGIGNNYTYTGMSIVMATQVGDVNGGQLC